jgi:hypothetical protein
LRFLPKTLADERVSFVMRRLALWIGLVLAVLATIGFTASALALEISREQARLESIAPAGPSTVKVHETVTLGRNGFAQTP